MSFKVFHENQTIVKISKFTVQCSLDTENTTKFISHVCFNIPDRRQEQMLLTIDKRGSKFARNSIFDCHLSVN